jgi:hypothetical protein
MAKEKFPVPDLPGWESLPFAAARLRVKRQRLFQMGTEEHKLKSLHKLPGAGDRPAAYVVATAEIDALLEVQRAAIAGHDETGTPLDKDGLVVNPDTGKAPGQGTHRAYAGPEALSLTPAGVAAAQ